MVGTPLDTFRNIKDIQKNESKFSRIRGISDEIGFSGGTAPQVAINFDRSKSHSEVSTNDLTNSGSSLTGAIVLSSPFAAAELLPPEVWNAIAILLKAAR